MKRAYRYLNYDDRQRIERMWQEGAKPKEIAEALGVHITTVYDELKRGDTGEVYADYRSVYNAAHAQQIVQDSIKRKGRRKKSA